MNTLKILLILIAFSLVVSAQTQSNYTVLNYTQHLPIHQMVEEPTYTTTYGLDIDDYGYRDIVIPGEQYHTYYYIRAVYQFNLTSIPPDAYNITAYVEAYRTYGSGNSKLVSIPDNQNFNDLESCWSNAGSGNEYLTVDVEPTHYHDLTSTIVSKLGQGHINFGVRPPYWSIQIYGDVNIRLHIYYDLPNNITADNNFTAPDGTTHGLINVDSNPQTAPYPFSRDPNANVSLQALTQEDNQGYFRSWNTGDVSHPNYPSKWERWRPGYQYPDDRGSFNPLNFTTTNDDDNALYKANLRKLYHITVNYKTEGGTILDGWETDIFEQNSDNVYARPILPGTQYSFFGWEDDLSAPNPRTITPTDNESYTALYKAPRKSNSPTAYKNNNQRKFLRTPDGNLHSVYESMNGVWYEYSTDNGQTWQIQGYSVGSEQSWVHSEPSLSYYINSSNQTVVVQFWRLQRGAPNDWLRFREYIYENSAPIIAEDEGLYLENSEMTGEQYTSPVVSCASNGKILFVWESKINGTPGKLRYSFGEKLISGYWEWYDSGELDFTVNGASQPAVYASIINGNLKFHLVWKENSNIYYCYLYPDANNQLQNSAKTCISEKSGYTVNYNPVITSADQVYGGNRYEYLRIA